MTTADGAARPGARALGRAAAGLAVAGSLLHLLLLDATSLASLAMAATAAVCLPCAWQLWRRPTRSAWRTTVLADVTMLLLHAQLLGEPAAGGAAHAAHHGAAPGAPAWTGLALVAGSLAAGAVALAGDRRARHRRGLLPSVHAPA
ncbi:hypothetical protein SAMN05660690_2088 [Geodermatophilus telluris]|uniref:Uncharacterized protein n=1 Tax=Geodermatophilus telluris TaxID=1190417 RepID=A0A1G6MXG7_9ACTN|nr:hypothetical protein [Geodermatophilus telluris]SDC60141.1 hypothetical protein SAMN05660690_2088 [Geodermatophilus telluris]